MVCHRKTLLWYRDREEANTAIEKAVDYPSTQQNQDGVFADSWNGANSNSTAMVIIGLCAVGVNPDTDSRFIKGDKSLVDGLMSFLKEDKSAFGYMDNCEANSLSTEQSFRALNRVKKEGVAKHFCLLHLL